MLHLSHDLHWIFILHRGAWRQRCRLGDAKFFFGKIWRKLVKPFFQSIGIKKSKIVDKITSKLEVLNRDGAKIVLVEYNH
jgi:hypothetical protein